jgi:DNA-binding NtrC family response regulator
MASLLVIDDDQRIREAIARSLTDDEHSVRNQRSDLGGARIVLDLPTAEDT